MEINVNDAFDKVVGKLDSWVELFVSMLPNMALSVVLFLLFLVTAKLGVKLFINLFRKTSSNLSLENLFSSIIYYSIMGVGIFIILGVLNLDKAVTSLLAGVGVVGLALGFAFQDVAANFVSGIILAFRKPFKTNDVVEILSYMGIIQKTTLRVTILKTHQGQEIYIPNKDVLQNPIINYSVLGKRRIDLQVGISYGDDLEKVENIVSETIKNIEGIILKEKLIFDYHAFGDSSINFSIRFWINYHSQPNFLLMRNKAIKEIKAAFDKNDITIPFPIRTLDFGIKGGQTLSDMQPFQIGKSN